MRNPKNKYIGPTVVHTILSLVPRWPVFPGASKSGGTRNVGVRAVGAPGAVDQTVINLAPPARRGRQSGADRFQVTAA